MTRPDTIPDDHGLMLDDEEKEACAAFDKLFEGFLSGAISERQLHAKLRAWGWPQREIDSMRDVWLVDRLEAQKRNLLERGTAILMKLPLKDRTELQDILVQCIAELPHYPIMVTHTVFSASISRGQWLPWQLSVFLAVDALTNEGISATPEAIIDRIVTHKMPMPSVPGHVPWTRQVHSILSDLDRLGVLITTWDDHVRTARLAQQPVGVGLAVIQAKGGEMTA